MNLSDVAILLGTVSAYDLRIEVSEFKARAWHESLDEDLPLKDAQKLVYWYYSNYDAAISPSAINREWRRRKATLLEIERGRQLSEEMEKHKANKASPEAVQRYLDEIRSKIGKSKDAPVDRDSGEVAPNL